MKRSKNNSTISLREISLINFATFKNQKITFAEGLNAVIGETGSGKSLVLDALQFILGSRADRSFIRKNCESAVIEASFEVNENAKLFFQQIGFPLIEENLLIKRVLHHTGKTKSYINLQQCNLADLLNVAHHFVDLVGQFDNQKLLSSSYQRELIDTFSDKKMLLATYRQHFFELKELENLIKDLNEKSTSKTKDLDYIDYQITQLEQVELSESHEQELVQRKSYLQNNTVRQTKLVELKNLINNGTFDIIECLGSCIRLLDHPSLEKFDKTALTEATSLLEDFSYVIEREINSCDQGVEHELNEVLEELDKIQKLKRKFNCTTRELNNKLQFFIEQRSEIICLESKIEEATQQLNEKKKICQEYADQISSHRKKAAQALSRSLSETIQNLNMQGATLLVEITPLDQLSEHGQDQVSFIAETNPGEGFYPLKKVASGGELSRILLAMRKTISSSDSISIFLFDEIDTGVGGETALKIGECLHEVASKSQVIAITHLPQIARFAKKLISVSKMTRDRRTTSHILEIQGKGMKETLESMVPLQ